MPPAYPWNRRINVVEEFEKWRFRKTKGLGSLPRCLPVERERV